MPMDADYILYTLHQIFIYVSLCNSAREEQICERLRLKNDMVRCDDSGSFSSEQTKDGSRFYCVNKETGVRLNLRYFMRGNGSCDSGKLIVSYLFHVQYQLV